jgi:hypothetical protein
MKNRANDSGDVPWLKDMVGDDLEVLFSEDQRVLERAVRRMIHSLSEDSKLEGELIELLEASLEHQNDDSSASLCATIILGEARSIGAVDVLQRGLASDSDEALQDAAAVALLRIGAPAVLSLLETLEADADPRLYSPAYSLLGMVGVLEDEGLKERVLEFLESRVETERKKPIGERALEEVFRAHAQLGNRRHLPIMKRVLAEDYRGYHPGIQDAIEMLEENAAGIPIVTTSPPWEEHYGWLFDDDREEARVARGRPRRDPDEKEDRDGDEEADEERDMSMFFWGLNATAGGKAPRESGDDEGRDEGRDVGEGEDKNEGEEKGYDARRYLERPGE